jgi:hypothetical protein
MTPVVDLTAEIEARIRCRTGGRVREICVHLDDQKVVIYGDAPTYYAMQLATAAVADLFPDLEIINAIEVS